MNADDQKPDLPPILIALFRGVVYQDQHPQVWQSLLRLAAPVRDHVSLFGLELRLDEAEGYAYLRQADRGEEGTDLPRLVQRRQLSYPVSLLLALLRKRLAEHDAGGGDVRLILSQSQIVDLMQLFAPDSTNEAKLADRINADINRIVDLGFLRRLRGQDDQFEVSRILKAFVDAQWLSDFERHLSDYHTHLADS